MAETIEAEVIEVQRGVALQPISPTAVQGVDQMSYEELAEHINQSHTYVGTVFAHALQHSKRVGDLLVYVHRKLQKERDKAKKMTFEDWVNGNCNFSFSTANNYKAISKAWGLLQEKGITTVSGALRQLKGKGTGKADTKGRGKKPTDRVKRVQTDKFIKIITQHGFQKGQRDKIVSMIKDLFGFRLEVLDELPKAGRPKSDKRKENDKKAKETADRLKGQMKPKPAGNVSR